MNTLRQAASVSCCAIDAAVCTMLLLCGLDLVGQLVVRIPLFFVRNLAPRGVQSPLLQHVLAGFTVMLIVGLVIVVVMLRRELHEDAVSSSTIAG
jgi:hypothetical protein